MNMGLQKGLLAGLAVLVVEDDYFLAQELAEILEAEGARVSGPAGTLNEAMDLASSAPLDAAVLDVNLRHLTVQPVIEVLARRGIPLLLLTGADLASLPPDLCRQPIMSKPVDERALVAHLASFAQPSADFPDPGRPEPLSPRKSPPV
ncbi:response regulator [Cereibacter sediminicola]|uniref:response regulator n=1 Tax=Cereibacter sediminicola TaxID=2584941 RepID=UPI00119D2215|nr:response regulator [Cereibacter sediminicola]